MAIYHLESQIISRGSGRSAVAAAAYRHAARMKFEREGRITDFSNKKNVAHAEFVAPEDAPDWLKVLMAEKSASQIAEAFWNRVESSEVRADAQLAKEFVLSLPKELTEAQNIELVRDFVGEHMLSRGMVADWVYHDVDANPHVHIMTTLRPLTEEGFGAKKVAVVDQDGNLVRGRDGKIVYRLWAGDKAVLTEMREAWALVQNAHLAKHGIDARVDHRSYQEQGIELTPQGKVGVQTHNMAEKAKAQGREIDLDRMALHEDLRRENAARIARRPEIVIDAISRESSVFDERDVAKHLHRWIDDGQQFQNLLARIMDSPELVMLASAGVELRTGEIKPAQFATREMVRIEETMARQARHLSSTGAFGAAAEVRNEVLASHRQLSDEQRDAIELVTGNERLALIVGRAGAGKTTMMNAARQIWEASGYRVVGGALAGKAADGLRTGAGIESRTLASWAVQWEQGRLRLTDKTVLVIDEAGMVSSRQMADFVSAVAHAGAKLVLVGDPDQLQPIAAGGAFRALSEQVRFAELSTIYRQREQWMREASMALARGKVGEALSAYYDRGHIIERANKDDAILSMVDDWVAEYDPQNSTTLMLAFMRKDVARLNALARQALCGKGLVDEGKPFQTVNGPRSFATGDRVVFLQNEASLGVKNGMLGRVVEAERGKIVVETGSGQGANYVEIEQHLYAQIDHGYAATIHKSQGVTIDKVKVLASSMFDRHLTYVALTRHRDAVQLYAGADDFGRTAQVDHAHGVTGVVIKTGQAKFRESSAAKPTPYVDLRDGSGKTHRLWGVNLPETIERAGARVGDSITLQRKGTEAVTINVPLTDPLTGAKRLENRTVTRNVWQARRPESCDDRKAKVLQSLERSALLGQMIAQFSRSRAKTTTRDFAGSDLYDRAVGYATRRGLHWARVTKAAVRNQTSWLARQRDRLNSAGERLAIFVERLGRNQSPAAKATPERRPSQPWLRGRAAWRLTVEQAVEKAMQSDAQLTMLWAQIERRVSYIYDQPKEAMAAMQLAKAMVGDKAAANVIDDQLARDPGAYGPLRGKMGVFASRSARAEHHRAMGNIPALRDQIANFLRVRGEFSEQETFELTRHRGLAGINVPQLSAAGKAMLERVRDAIVRNELDAGIDQALSDHDAKAQIDRLYTALQQKFGKQAFASREPKGPGFEAAAARISKHDRTRLAQAWPLFHAARQIAVHERNQVRTRAQTSLRRQEIAR